MGWHDWAAGFGDENLTCGFEFCHVAICVTVNQAQAKTGLGVVRCQRRTILAGFDETKGSQRVGMCRPSAKARFA